MKTIRAVLRVFAPRELFFHPQADLSSVRSGKLLTPYVRPAFFDFARECKEHLATKPLIDLKNRPDGRPGELWSIGHERMCRCVQTKPEKSLGRNRQRQKRCRIGDCTVDMMLDHLVQQFTKKARLQVRELHELEQEATECIIPALGHPEEHKRVTVVVIIFEKQRAQYIEHARELSFIGTSHHPLVLIHLSGHREIEGDRGPPLPHGCGVHFEPRGIELFDQAQVPVSRGGREMEDIAAEPLVGLFINT